MKTSTEMYNEIKEGLRGLKAFHLWLRQREISLIKKHELISYNEGRASMKSSDFPVRDNY